MEINREQLAWAAGLFEGEGCFTSSKPRDLKGNCARGVGALIKMTDKDVLDKFCSVVGVGNVSGPLKRSESYDKASYKPIYLWQVGSFETVQHVIACLWPWLHSRRKIRIKEVLSVYHANPPQKIGGPVRKEAILSSLRSGKRTREVAKEFGVTDALISYYRRSL